MLRPHLPRQPQRSTRLLGSTPIAPVARLVTGGLLRVLAYHDVTDSAIFAGHLDLIQTHYHPVTGEQVATAIRDGTGLPRRAIWVTFDDANPGVFAIAMPLLAQRRVPATVFVCPGVVDTDQPYWWQVLDLALSSGRRIVHNGMSWSDVSIITHLKLVSDSSRRSTVARVLDELGEAGVSAAKPQATTAALREWLDLGLDIGNHTWDHPCLDMCDDDQQRHQIVAANDWLSGLLGRQPHLFAYPNGNVAGPSRAVLTRLGYSVTALFDHRMARPRGPEVSRLRIDADAPLERMAAIASGAHSAAYALAQRLRRARAVPGASG